MITEKYAEARGAWVPGGGTGTAVPRQRARRRPPEVSAARCQNALPSAHQNACCAGLAGS